MMTSIISILPFLTVMLMLISVGNGYNILMMQPMASRSHKNVFDAVAEALATKGHQVTIFSPINDTNEIQGVTNVLFEGSKALKDKAENMSFFNGGLLNLNALKNMFELLALVQNLTYGDRFVQGLIGHPRGVDGLPKYDVVVVDAVFNEFTLPIAHHMAVPAIYLSPSLIFPQMSWTLNIPNPCYIPAFMFFVDGPMTFVQRATSAIVNFVYTQLRYYLTLRGIDELVHNFLPNAPAMEDLERNVSFVLTNTHPSIYPSIPNMPYMVEVGGLHCKPAKKLPKDLEEFMQSSGEAGVIFFSMGSITKGRAIPLEMKEKIIEVFSLLPQKVLFKFETDIEGLPANIKLVQWAPQQDILGHPKMRLFITHGGGLSIQEAAYHKCPILGFPLSADQQGNMGNVKRNGYGETLNWKTFTTQEFLAKINLVINDKSYKENAVRLSSLFRDRPEHPAKTAAYWIEYVVKHGGAPHLKSDAEQLNFFQYFLLDVIGAIFAVIALTFLLIAYILKKLYNLLFRAKRNNSRQNRKVKKQ